MQLDPAFRPSQPGLDQLRMMVTGIVQKDVDEPAVLNAIESLLQRRR
jgi:hypothetical protein